MRLVDVTELFLRELRVRGVEQTWFSGPAEAPGPMRKEYVNGIEIIVPPNLETVCSQPPSPGFVYWLLWRPSF